jgi:hypothetical protein
MLNDFMVKIFGLNWRTTLAGIVLATGNIVNDYVTGTITLRTFVLSFALAVAGYIIKDAKVTGTELNPRAQIVGDPTPAPSPAAQEKIAVIEAEKK